MHPPDVRGTLPGAYINWERRILQAASRQALGGLLAIKNCATRFEQRNGALEVALTRFGRAEALLKKPAVVKSATQLQAAP